jgi:thiamine kinase-like enzyme
MKFDDQELLSKVLAIVKEDIENRRTIAAYNGERSDGGAGHIQRELDVFLAVVNGHFPPTWKSYIEKAKQEGDPEYEKYLELKKKFGGK